MQHGHQNKTLGLKGDIQTVGANAADEQAGIEFGPRGGQLRSVDYRADTGV